jgi:hypothetical protein
MMTSADWWQGFLKGYDELTSWWKGSVLAIFPGYFNRNAVTNFLHSGVAGAFSPKAYMKAGQFIKAAGYNRENPHIGKLWGTKPKLSTPHMALDQIEVAGYKGNQLHEMIQNFFGIRHGFLKEHGPKARTKFIEGKATKIAKGALLHHEGAVVKAGFNIGGAVEDWQRIGHFFAELENGKTPMEAAMSVKKYLFDYSELTGFEKAFMKRVMPFYSWSRKNMPMWAELAVRRPGVFSQLQRLVEAFQTDEVKQMDRALLPKWANKAFGIPLTIDKTTGDVKVSVLQNWLSMADLTHVVRENPIHGMARFGLQNTNPIPKTLMELITNQSYYTGRPIEEFPGEPYGPDWPFPGAPKLSKRMVHIIKSMPPYGRAFAELFKATTPKTPTGESSIIERALNFASLTPKLKSFNIEKLKESMKFDTAVRKGKLKRMLNKAKKYGSADDVRYIRDLLKDVSGNAN